MAVENRFDGMLGWDIEGIRRQYPGLYLLWLPSIEGGEVELMVAV